MKEKKIIDYIRNNKKTLAEIIFYIGFSIELVIMILDKSPYTNPIQGRMFQLAFVFFFVKMLMTKYTAKEFVVIIIFGILGLLSDSATDNNTMIRFILFIVSSKNISCRKTLIYTFYATLGMVIGLALLSVTGIAGTVAMVEDFGRGGIETRYTLGMGHPNGLHCMVWALTTLGIYLYHKRMKGYHYLILFAFNHGMYLLTSSKTGMLVTVAILIMAVVLHYGKRIREQSWLYFLGTMFLLSCVAFSILSVKLFDTIPFFQQINEYVNNRILIAFQMSGDEIWTLFSNTSALSYFDMGIVRLFDWYGIIIGGIVTILICLMINQSYKEKDYMGFMLIISFVFYSVFESHAVSVYLTRDYVLLLLVGNWVKLIGNNIYREMYFFEVFTLSEKRHKSKS